MNVTYFCTYAAEEKTERHPKQAAIILHAPSSHAFGNVRIFVSSRDMKKKHVHKLWLKNCKKC